jgi:hypothetical protein
LVVDGLSRLALVKPKLVVVAGGERGTWSWLLGMKRLVGEGGAAGAIGEEGKGEAARLLGLGDSDGLSDGLGVGRREFVEARRLRDGEGSLDPPPAALNGCGESSKGEDVHIVEGVEGDDGAGMTGDELAETLRKEDEDGFLTIRRGSVWSWRSFRVDLEREREVRSAVETAREFIGLARMEEEAGEDAARLMRGGGPLDAAVEGVR